MNKILLYMIAFLSLMSIVNALPVSVIRNNTWFGSVNTANDGNIFFSNFNDSGQYNTSTIVRYNINTNNLSDYSNGLIPSKNGLKIIYDYGLHNNTAFPKNVWKNGNRLIFFSASNNDSKEIYFYNTISNQWENIGTYTTFYGFTGGASTARDTVTYIYCFESIGAGNNLPVLRRYNSTNDNITTIPVTDAVCYNSNQGFNQYSPLFRSIDNATSTYAVFYQANVPYLYKINFTAIQSETASNLPGVPLNAFITKAAYDSRNTIAYVVTKDYSSNDKSKMYIMNLTTANVTSMTTLPGCSDFLTLNNITINDIECRDLNTCIAVGSYNESLIPVMFSFNTTSCEYQDISASVPYGDALYGITYNPSDNKYYVTGKNIIYSFGANVVSQQNINASGMCIDSQNFCTQPVILDLGNGQFNIQCDIDNIQFCNQGCNQDTNTCNNLGVNDCLFNGVEVDINGHRECTSSTSYAECGQFQNAPALSLQYTNCADYGSNLVCIDAQCVNATPSTNEIFYNTFNVVNTNICNTQVVDCPQQVSQSARILTVVNQPAGALNYAATFAIQQANNTGYYAYTCTYPTDINTNKYIRIDEPFDTLPYDNGWIGGNYSRITGSSSQPNIQMLYLNTSVPINKSFNTVNNTFFTVEYDLENYDNTSNNISGFATVINTGSAEVQTIYQERDYTNDSICTYLGSTGALKTTQLYCDYGISNYGVLLGNEPSNMTILLDFQNHKVTVDTNNQQGRYHHSAAFEMFNNALNGWDKVSFYAPNGTVLMDEVYIRGEYQFPALKTLNTANNFAISCGYNQQGVYQLRTYTMPYNNPTYNNFVDWTIDASNAHFDANTDQITICENGVCNTFNATTPVCTGEGCTTAGNLVPLSTEKKLLIAVIALIALLAIGVFIGVSFQMPSTITATVCITLFILGAAYFTVKRFIPPTLIVIIGLLAGAVIFFILRKPFVEGG